jgi:hypothetical protein
MGREGFEPSTLGLREPSRDLGLSRCVWILQGNGTLTAARVSVCLGPSRCHFAATFTVREEGTGQCNEWKLKGVPGPIELGERDLAAGTVVVARRDTGAKESVPFTGATLRVAEQLADVRGSARAA